MKKKLIRNAAVILAAVCMLSGCSKKEEPAPAPPEPDIHTSKDETSTPVPEPTPTEELLPEGMVNSYLSGQEVPEEIGRRRPVAVMLNNIQAAVPQTGIAKADVVYEAPVEGNITRLMGIFENYEGMEKIGSVRSCREYYIFFAQEFEAIYAHYGQAIYAKPFLAQDFIHNLSGLDQYGSDIYYRSTDRVAPHNAYTSFDGIQRGIKDYGYTQEYSEDYPGHYVFTEKDTEENLDNGAAANVGRLSCYPTNQPWFEYDGESKKYKRFQYGGPQIDSEGGEQLVYDNILIQYHSYEPYDQNGYLNIDAISGGNGKFVTHGKAIDIRWEKNEPWGQTHYFDENNQEIHLNRGKTWVSIVLDDKIDGVVVE